MKRLSIVGVLVGTLMLCTAVFAQWSRPTIHLADRIGKPDLETLFPARFGDWRVDTSMPVVLPAPDVQAKLNAIYNQVLSRTYINTAGERVMLSVAYGGDQSNGTRAHRPEVCYPAQGFQIFSSQSGVVDLPGQALPVRQLMSRLGGRFEPITYWIVVGGQVATSHVDQKLAELRYSVKGVIADGMLVRVSTIDQDAARGHAAQAKFITAMAAAVAGTAHERIFGAAPE